MSPPPWTPQFRARLTFHFREHDSPAPAPAADDAPTFTFGETGAVRVPMLMDGFDGLSSVALHSENPGPFRAGDTVEVHGRVAGKTFFASVVAPGVAFELHGAADGEERLGYFARGEVIERIEEGWV